MVGGILEGDDEANCGHCAGVYGGVVVILPEAGTRRGNGLFNSQGFYSALRYWLCSSVHFYPGEFLLDTLCLPFHGIYVVVLFLILCFWVRA